MGDVIRKDMPQKVCVLVHLTPIYPWRFDAKHDDSEIVGVYSTIQKAIDMSVNIAKNAGFNDPAVFEAEDDDAHYVCAGLTADEDGEDYYEYMEKYTIYVLYLDEEVYYQYE